MKKLSNSEAESKKKRCLLNSENDNFKDKSFRCIRKIIFIINFSLITEKGVVTLNLNNSLPVVKTKLQHLLTFSFLILFLPCYVNCILTTLRITTYLWANSITRKELRCEFLL